MPSLPLTERNTSPAPKRASTIAMVKRGDEQLANGQDDRVLAESDDEMGQDELVALRQRQQRSRPKTNGDKHREAEVEDHDEDEQGEEAEDEVDQLDQMDVEEEHEDDFDLSQVPKNAAERTARDRTLRAKYRSLGQSMQESRDNISDTTVEDLGKHVKRANTLFEHVTDPSVAVLDSRVLMAASDAGALKARQLKLDANAFDTDQFLVKLAQFMGGAVNVQGGKNKGKARETQDEDGGPKRLRWTRVGRVLAGESRRAVAIDLMLGPLAMEIKEKKARTQRARQKLDPTQRVRPEELRAEDIEKDKQATDRMISEINTILENIEGNAVPYLALVVNPHSFAQTVENIFYFSFLVRDGRACIEEEIDEASPYFGDFVCYQTEPPTADGDYTAGPKTQFVFELTHDLWKDAIEAYGLEEPMIPNRPGWEGRSNARRQS